MATYFEILCGVATLIVALYYYSISTFDFWKKRGVPGPKPLPFFGNTKDLMFVKVPMSTFVKDIYEKYPNEPMIGLFVNRSPILVLNDPDLIKDVLIRDFSNFVDRGFNVHERTEPLSLNLLNLEPKRWRPLRAKLSPIFTSGKLKDMIPLMLECSQHLEDYLDKLVAKGEFVECRELTAKFTTDVIGTCAFGLNMNAIAEEDSTFRHIGRKIFKPDMENILRLKTRLFLPKFYDLLGYVFPDRRFAPFFTKVVVDTMKYREEHKIVRHDFINMLMELKANQNKLDNIELTDSLLTAQAFVFFAAGFETSSSTMSNVLYELAQNHKIQDKLREEIRESYAKTGGDFKYENIKEMKYLDKVFKETLRKYPPTAILKRKSTSDYTFNGTKIKIPKGTVIWIPIIVIQHDPNIYPNPEIFDPERFNEDAIAARHPMHYLSFGDGPRNCIGARFAICQSKIGLIKILRNHKVDVCEKTIIPHEYDPGAFLLTPKHGVYVKLTKLES